MKGFLFTTTLLTSVITAGGVVHAQGRIVTQENKPAAMDNPATSAAPAPAAISPAQAATEEARFSAERMIEHVNYARIALALKEKSEALQHLAQARQMLAALERAAPDKRNKQRVQSGRFTYVFNAANRDHYFPIATAVVEKKEIDTGPFWSERKGVAVKNVEAAYISISVDAKEAAEKLNDAEAALNGNNLDKASKHLDELLDDAIDAEQTKEMPLVKAQDNLTLARHFLRAKNYEGARYALGHAEDAIEEMKDDNRYGKYNQRIQAMHTEVKQLQDRVAKKDPTTLDKAEAQLSGWWNELKTWASDTM